MERNVLSSLTTSEGMSSFNLSTSEFEEVHVLAVDNSLVDHKVIEQLLKITSCKEFQSLKVNLIITDYYMPGMTGYELLKKIKESFALREIPMVIMSPENVVTRINRCLHEGVEDFIVKPMKLSDMKRLKDYMTKEGNQERGVKNNERKLRETCDLSSLSSTSQSQSPSPSLSCSTPSSLPQSSLDTTLVPSQYT